MKIKKLPVSTQNFYWLLYIKKCVLCLQPAQELDTYRIIMSQQALRPYVFQPRSDSTGCFALKLGLHRTRRNAKRRFATLASARLGLQVVAYAIREDYNRSNQGGIHSFFTFLNSNSLILKNPHSNSSLTCEQIQFQNLKSIQSCASLNLNHRLNAAS